MKNSRPAQANRDKIKPGQKLRQSGAEGNRTLNLCIANAALSQLSYRPSVKFRISGPAFEGKIQSTPAETYPLLRGQAGACQ